MPKLRQTLDEDENMLLADPLPEYSHIPLEKKTEIEEMLPQRILYHIAFRFYKVNPNINFGDYKSINRLYPFLIVTC